MSLSYAELQTRVLQMLQDTGGATYDSTELGYWTEDELKRISQKTPHVIDVIFQIESRKGTDATGTASSLTDSVKSQFLSTDPTSEKVVHNIKDDTWAVVLTQTSTSILTLSADIMDANEQYEIYNKRCKSNKQIYIGDMPLYLWVESVEYPIGTERNFTVYDDVLELDVEDSTIQDSNSTLDTLRQVDVLVRFAMPHVLSQLTDLVGALSSGAAKADTSVSIDSMGDTEIIEVGEEFHLGNKRFVYVIDTQVTTSAQSATINFFPPLEDAAISADIITFRKSTLQPEHEEILALRVVGRAIDSDKLNFLNATNIGGPQVWQRYRQEVQDKLNEANISLAKLASPKPAKKYPRT